MDFLSGTATDNILSSSALNASVTPLSYLDLSEPISPIARHPSGVITVNSTADVVDDFDGVTTLREAINFANADATDDVILFERSLEATPQTISLSLGQLSITHNLSIIAPRDTLTGGNLVTVSGNNTSRVFEISSGATVDISGLIIADGNATGDNGGGIKNSGILNLDSSIVRNNFAQNGGGGISNSGGATLTVSNSTIIDNLARRTYDIYVLGDGGGILNSGDGSTVKVSNSTISNNQAGNNGGGIHNRGTTGTGNNTSISSGKFEVNNSTITENSAGNYGGGIFNGIDDIGGENFSNSLVAVNNSTISGNSARSGGGITSSGRDSVLTVSYSTLSSNRAVNGNGGAIDHGGNFSTVEISNSTLSSNTAGSGGGISNTGYSNTLKVIDSTLNSNSAGIGGAIYNSRGNLEVSNSTISNNSATFLSLPDFGLNGGGGIYNNNYSTRSIVKVSNSTIRDNTSVGSGGGIYNAGSGPGSSTINFEINDTIISGNKAGQNGGGIFNRENSFFYISSDAILKVSNSTISGNSAGNNGGGIFNRRINLDLAFSTLTLNQAANGGGVFNDDSGSASARNTIIAANLLSTDGVNPDVAGNFTSNGYNLIGDGTGSTGFDAIGDIVGTSTDPIVDS